MKLHLKINEVLDALGDESLSTKEIIPKLKKFKTTRRSLSNFITQYMVNRYVSKERDYGPSKIITFKTLPLILRIREG